MLTFFVFYLIHSKITIPHKKVIYIKQGQTVNEIVETLKNKNLIKNHHLFKLLLKLTGNDKKIQYEPFWEIKDLLRVIKKKENYNFILNKVESEEVLSNFVENAEKCLLNKKCSDFDFNAGPGDLLIFNDSGIHRGSNPSLNERVVLRYLYTKEN